jgi:putative oxidoreductase
MNANPQTLPKFSGGANIALWILQILSAVVFLIAGFSKLSGSPLMIEAFDRIGLGQWFRYFTGAVEIIAAVLLLVPRTIATGALLLVCTMFGAIAAHLFVFHDSPLVPLVLLVFNVFIFWKRFEVTQ